MFSKFTALTAVVVTLAALSGLQGVSAGPTPLATLAKKTVLLCVCVVKIGVEI